MGGLSVDNIKNEYLLLTPGPLTTTARVKRAMMRDWCTWDDEYNSMIQSIRKKLVSLAVSSELMADDYTAVLMQGSGTFCVESVIGSVIPEGSKLAILSNGAYGRRIAEIAAILKIAFVEIRFKETEKVQAEALDELLADDSSITHVAAVHCETTTGILNGIEDIARVVNKHGKVFIVDAMSSFGGVPFFLDELKIDFMVSSANKCIQGVPGFGFIIARKVEMEKCCGTARSLALDLFSQWETMEKCGGKWRFTSPTHVVKAFDEALKELEEEGGIPARHERYKNNQRRLLTGMKELGFKPLLDEELHSPIITSFNYPAEGNFSFKSFYDFMKKEGYVLYPGKISQADTIRIGNIGDVEVSDIEKMLLSVKKYLNAM